MKRPISPTLSFYHDISNTEQGLPLKRQRLEQQKKKPSLQLIIDPIIIKKQQQPQPMVPVRQRRRRVVRFADPMEQQTIIIPSIVDREEKQRLYYSNVDFAKFAFQEKLRRDALILTVAVGREQLKRMKRHQPIISSPSVIMMYHKILTRTENDMLMQRQKQQQQQQQQQQGEKCNRSSSSSSSNTVLKVVQQKQNTKHQPLVVDDVRRHIVIASMA